LREHGENVGRDGEPCGKSIQRRGVSLDPRQNQRQRINSLYVDDTEFAGKTRYDPRCLLGVDTQGRIVKKGRVGRARMR
jgi:hypothetical protein